MSLRSTVLTLTANLDNVTPMIRTVRQQAVAAVRQCVAGLVYLMAATEMINRDDQYCVEQLPTNPHTPILMKM